MKCSGICMYANEKRQRRREGGALGGRMPSGYTFGIQSSVVVSSCIIIINMYQLELGSQVQVHVMHVYK